MQVQKPFGNRPAPNLYPHISFDPYEYRQFPEWVTPAGGGDPVLVTDEEEKARALGGVGPDVGAEDEKTSLYVIAERKGIVVDKRWSLDTLRAKVGA
jgi:hypothetical protein